MIKILLVISTSFIVCCSETSLGRAKQDGDSIYVRVDSTTVDRSNNSFDFVLTFKSNNKSHNIYRVKNQDYSIEFEYSFSFSDNSKSYLCYTIYDLPTGVTWNIIYDNNQKTFYRTDVYDLQALGDKLVKESVDFQKHTASVKSYELSKLYQIKLKKIKW